MRETERIYRALLGAYGDPMNRDAEELGECDIRAARHHWAETAETR